MTPLIQKLVPLTKNAEQFHWFDIGEMSNDLTVIDGSDPIASRLAFPQCAFAYTEGGYPGVLLMTQRNETSIHVTPKVNGPHRAPTRVRFDRRVRPDGQRINT